MTKKKIRYNYNAYYGTEQKVILWELWRLLVLQTEEIRKEFEKKKEYREKLTKMRLANLAKGKKKNV
jgi:hypothetical protein